MFANFWEIVFIAFNPSLFSGCRPCAFTCSIYTKGKALAFDFESQSISREHLVTTFNILGNDKPSHHHIKKSNIERERERERERES